MGLKLAIDQTDYVAACIRNGCEMSCAPELADPDNLFARYYDGPMFSLPKQNFSRLEERFDLLGRMMADALKNVTGPPVADV